jgi:hypothetical protein
MRGILKAQVENLCHQYKADHRLLIAYITHCLLITETKWT